MARKERSLGADGSLECSRERTSIEGSGFSSTMPTVPSLSTRMVWKVEAELFSPVVAMDSAVEVVVVEVRLPGMRLEGVVVAE
jgi:hypothetical protein